VYGHTSTGGTAVLGSASTGNGVYGTATTGSAVRGVASTSGYGVYGQSATGTGVNGVTSGSTGRGVYGSHTSTGLGYGVYGETTSISGGSGVYGAASGASGTNYGVRGYANYGYGVYGSSSNGHAGYFNGKLEVTGNTTMGGTLGVTGNTTMGGTLGVTGNTTVGGTLGVTGNTTMGGTLTVNSHTLKENTEIEFITAVAAAQAFQIAGLGTPSLPSGAYGAYWTIPAATNGVFYLPIPVSSNKVITSIECYASSGGTAGAWSYQAVDGISTAFSDVTPTTDTGWAHKTFTNLTEHEPNASYSYGPRIIVTVTASSTLKYFGGCTVAYRVFNFEN